MIQRTKHTTWGRWTIFRIEEVLNDNSLLTVSTPCSLFSSLLSSSARILHALPIPPYFSVYGELLHSSLDPLSSHGIFG
jgi:hypothetical protein